jgi:GTPase SAR1 family protein
METESLVLSGVAAVLGGGLAFVGAHALGLRQKLVRTSEELATSRHRLAAAEPAVLTMSSDVQLARATVADLTRRLEGAHVEDQRKEGLLNYQQEEIDFLRAELEKRPKVMRKTYKIITIGMKSTGKTSLTLKWANPLIDLGMLQGTKIERYERTVSQVAAKDVTTEHVFEIGDWGGEHIVDALHELILDEIHGMLLVVDLGGKDAKAVDPARIEEQLRQFQPQSLQYFFGPKTVASCKTVVLFINKSDLLPGTPAEAEAQAKQLYAKLVGDLARYKEKVDIRVLVGSASYGHSTHLLFSHFVERILPRNAYDNQLLQRLKADLPAPHTPRDTR